MAELAMTVFVVLLILGAMNIPALGDAIGRRVRRPSREPPPAGLRTGTSGPPASAFSTGLHDRLADGGQRMADR
jgi:hypothetical protein